MCFACWNVDDMEEKLKQNKEICDGSDMPSMTLFDLKEKIYAEWQDSKKTHFRVFKKAVPEASESTISWIIPLSGKEEKITVNFIT